MTDYLESPQALHKDIKATFLRAPSAADSYVSTEVRWHELEKLFQNPKESWFAFLNAWGMGTLGCWTDIDIERNPR